MSIPPDSYAGHGKRPQAVPEMGPPSGRRASWWVRSVPFVCVGGVFVSRVVAEVGTQGLGALGVDMAIALGLAVIILPLVLGAVQASLAQAVEEIQAARPGAVVVGAIWSQLYMGPFLKPGPAARGVKGSGGPLLLVAGSEGIEVVAVRKRVAYGRIPWVCVEEIRLTSMRAPISAGQCSSLTPRTRTRPTRVISSCSSKAPTVPGPMQYSRRSRRCVRLSVYFRRSYRE